MSDNKNELRDLIDGISKLMKDFADMIPKKDDGEVSFVEAFNHGLKWPTVTVEKDDLEAALDALGVDQDDTAEEKPAGDLWEITFHDPTIGNKRIRADEVTFGAALSGGLDEGFAAYLNDQPVFYAPAGTYTYAKKIAA